MPVRAIPILRRLTPALIALSMLTACDDGAAQREAVAAAAARAEAAAAEMQRNLEQAIENERPDLARAFAEDLLVRYPNTAAGKAIAPKLEQLRQAADEDAERRRLSGLWTYHAVDDAKAGGTVRTAYIHGASAASGFPDVRLVLRRHPAWGQSVYLLIHGGDFACQGECRIPVIVNAEAAGETLISRAKDVNPPAVFIERDAEFLQTVLNAGTITLPLPLLDGRTGSYDFEVLGFDIERLGPEIGPK